MEYGTSYFGVRDVRHAERDLERFKTSGLNAVLHTFSERDQAYYQETFSALVDASHERDLTVYANPWGVGRVFGGEAFSEFIGRNPDCCQRLSTGERLPAACFNNETFREFMFDWIDDVTETGVDIVFWDEPHWYIPSWHGETTPDGEWSCRCEYCQQKYIERYDERMPATETDQVITFRERSLLSFLDEMMERVHEKGAKNAVCMLPSESTKHGLRDWEELVMSDYLDVFASDPYWTGYDTDAKSFTRRIANRVGSLADEHNLRSQIWIQGFKLDAGQDTIDNVRRATREAIDSGVDSVFMWSWDGTQVMSDIACEDPESVWQAYLSELDT